MKDVIKYLEYIGILSKKLQKGKLPEACGCVLEKAVGDLVDRLYRCTENESWQKTHKACSRIRESVSRYHMIANEGIGEECIGFLKERLSEPDIQELFSGDAYFQQNIVAKCNPNQLHHRICKCIFREIRNMKKNGNYFWVQMDHDDSWIRNQAGEMNGFEPGEYIRLSLLSESAIAYDNIIFTLLGEGETQDSQYIYESYRPFFMEYYIETESLNDAQRDFLRRMDRETEGNGRNGNDGYGGYGWYRAHFADGDESAEDGSVLFRGVYAFSASPVEYGGRKLIIDTTGLDQAAADKINSTYQIPVKCCASDRDICQQLEKIFDGVAFHNTRVYKVGNGNCIYSYGWSKNGERRLLYDVGFDNNVAIQEKTSHMPFSYQPALNSIRNLIPQCVVLSHWDADHYKACAYCRRELFECMWIAPYCGDASVNAKRLGKYLQLIGKMMFVDRSYAREIDVKLTGNSILRLYVGEKKRGERLTAANCEGIAIRLENGMTRCLMQGDVPYVCLPAQADFIRENPYDYLVAPHHGSDMDLSLLQAQNNKQGNAVICCNDNKSKVQRRPAKKHLQALQNCYADVEVTEKAVSYVELDLMTRSGMLIR